MSLPEWPWWELKPPGVWTVMDLDLLPTHRVDLLDGTPIMLSAASNWHQTVMLRLGSLLDDLLPDTLEVIIEPGVRLDQRNQPEPDLAVVRADTFDVDISYNVPADVLLVVEIVSPESEKRDWKIKPAKYAAGGIPHMWIIERAGDRPVVHTFELDGGSYRPTGVHTERVEVTRPAALSFGVDAITPRRSGLR